MADGSALPVSAPPLASTRCFVMIIGNARSGSTLLGAVLDGHPRAVVANESAASFQLWRGWNGPDILRDVLDNASQMAAEGRLSEGYRYQVGPPPEAKPEPLVAGDKAWNPALLILHGNPHLLGSLEERLGIPVRLVHAIRNPYDVIATMHRRSGAPIEDRIRWYFMHCEAAAAVRSRQPADRFLDAHHADLVADPATELARLLAFLALPLDGAHLEATRGLLFSRPRRTSKRIDWQPAQIAEIASRMKDFAFLDRYRDEQPAEFGGVD